MNDEDAFVQALLATPQDDDLRLVYADWLEERGDAADKVAYLRLTVQLATQSSNPGRRIGRRKLRKLAAKLDKDWLAVVSRLPIENCQRRGERKARPLPAFSLKFAFPCQRGWEELQTTEDPKLRFCDECKYYVHYCTTAAEAQAHAQKRHCIAVDLEVDRNHRPSAPQVPGGRRLLGRVSPS